MAGKNKTLKTNLRTIKKRKRIAEDLMEVYSVKLQAISHIVAGYEMEIKRLKNAIKNPSKPESKPLPKKG